MGLVTLFMFCSNCLLGAHGYAIDGFCGFLGSCFVPIACHRGEQLPSHRIWGCATSIIGFLFSLPLLAFKFIFTCREETIRIKL